MHVSDYYPAKQKQERFLDLSKNRKKKTHTFPGRLRDQHLKDELQILRYELPIGKRRDRRCFIEFLIYSVELLLLLQFDSNTELMTTKIAVPNHLTDR